MQLCYLDESGTPDIPGTTSHYVLAGLSIPIDKWIQCEKDVNNVKMKFDLTDKEIHTGWLLKNYGEQKRVNNFSSLSYGQRRIEVKKLRTANLLSLQRQPNKKSKYKQTKKNYAQSEHYIHLTIDERKSVVKELATVVGRWGFARLFAECIDKIHFNSSKQTADEQAFEQLVSRYEAFLRATSNPDHKKLGIMIHDNNQTVAKRHTDLMKSFHRKGTLWTAVNNIIETPLFVDSSLTSMIQIADLCSYALRRYCENGETELFDLIYKRADKKDGVVVGVRHFTDLSCTCKICSNHRKPIVGELFNGGTSSISESNSAD